MQPLKAIYKKILRSNFVNNNLIPFLLYVYINLVFWTSKKVFLYSAGFDKKKYQNENAIYAFWHNRLVMQFFLKPKKIKVNVLLSLHSDGQLIASVSKLFGTDVIFGSTSKGAISALKNIFSVLTRAKESLAITPDGPRGPAFQINSNVIKIAAMTGCPIIPLAYSSSRHKTFNSWDKFILPLPFSKLCFGYGTPIKVARDVDEYHEMKAKSLLRKELNNISQGCDKMVQD